MSKLIDRIVPMPTTPEESWRRTDPEMFFLPNGEVLNAAGGSANGGFSGWNIQSSELSAADMENKVLSLSGALGAEVIEWLREGDLWNRLHLVTIGAGVAQHAHLRGAVSGKVTLHKEVFVPSSLIPGSVVSLATSERLAYSAGEEIVVKVESEHNQAEPIVIVDQSASDLAQSYSVVKIVGSRNSRFSLVVIENAAAFSMHRHSILLEDGAKVMQLWIHAAQANAAKSRCLSEREVRLATNAEFYDAQIFAPQGTLRCISNVLVEGSGAKAKSGAAVVAGGNSRLDYEPWQEHRVQKSHTELKAKYLVSETAKAVFQGLIRVEREAVQTVALQENKNLLIGKRSRVDALPRLEILPNDVMCKHGSATGQLDTRHIYYLGTRGFSEDEARAMIVRGFVIDGLGALPIEHPLQALASACLTRILAGVTLV